MSEPTSSAEERAREALKNAMLGTQVPDPVDLTDLVARLRNLDLPGLSVLSPKNLQNQFNQLSRHLSECQGIVSDLQSRKTLAKKRASTLRMAVQLAKRYLFQGDPEVRAGRSLEDREAVAAVKLSQEIIEMHQAETAVANFESALLLAQDRLRHLKDRRATLRDQKDLMQAEMYISRDGFGSEPRSTVYSAPFRPTGPYVQDSERVIADLLDPPLQPHADEIRQVRSKSSVSS